MQRYQLACRVKTAALTFQAKDGLFTSQDCCSGEEVIHDAVLKYCEWITTKPM
jgi:hypothetical protein